MSAYAGPEIVTNGLVVTLDAANSKCYSGSGTTLTDISGNGRNGTLTNGPTYDGQSIVFDGIDDSMTANLTGVPNFSALTINVWHYSNTSNNTCLINNFPFILHFRGAGFYLRNNETPTPNESGYLAWQTAPSGLRWNMITGTWNGSTMKLYLNGDKQSNERSYSGGTTGLLGNNTNVTIGGFFNSSQSWTDGKISYASIYNRALSDEEILQNYRALRGRFGI